MEIKQIKDIVNGWVRYFIVFILLWLGNYPKAKASYIKGFGMLNAEKISNLVNVLYAQLRAMEVDFMLCGFGKLSRN
jgi:hypothetical protein